MSSRRAGGGRGGGGGGDDGGGNDKEARAIPETVRKTIQSIRETTGKQHSDEDILTVLEDCSMDADETAQRLLYLDTFHEVRRKPRKKETFSTQVRGTRGFRGNNSDLFGGRSSAPRRGNMSNHAVNNNNAPPTGIRAPSMATNGPSSLPDGSYSLESNPPLLANGVTKDGSAADGKRIPSPKLPPVANSSSSSRLYSSVIQSKEVKFTSSSNYPSSAHSVSAPGPSSSDPVFAQSMSAYHAVVGASNHDLLHQGKPAAVETDTSTSDHDESEPSMQDKIVYWTANLGKKNNAAENPMNSEKNDTSQSPSSPKQNGFLSTKSPSLDANTMEEMVSPLKDGRSCSPALPETTVANGHVIFPNHFKVPEDVKSGLVFGNFEAKVGRETNSDNVNGCKTELPACTIDSAARADKIAGDSSDQGVTTVQVDQPSSCDDGHGLESVSQGESNNAPVVDSKNDQPNQETRLVLEGHQVPLVQVTPSYNHSIMPQMGHLLQFEGHDTRAQDTSSVSTVSESPTPASTGSTPPAQINLAASPQPVLFRPPYHPSYFPYGHYFHPYFFPPMHQFLSHNGLPQQPSTANAYLASAPTAPGVKFSLPHLKPGAGAGNPTPTGLPPLYGAYGSNSVGYNPSQTVTSGSSASNGDILASQQKENNIYTTGPPSEVSAWIPPPGQDISNMQLNSLYHLPAQGQHLTFSPAQAGHGPFAGLYQTGQTVAGPSTLNQLSQLSQAVSTAVESGGQQSGAFQQPSLAPVNWNSSY